MVQLYDKESLLQDASVLEAWQQQAFSAFIDKMSDKEHPFPCIPGQTGFMQNHLRYSFIDDLRTHDAARQLAGLMKEYSSCSRDTGRYASLIVFIHTPEDLIQSSTVEDFEKLYWSLMNETAALDEKEWPAHIPQNPMQNTWEYCFHGESYFAYCATPAHVRRQSRHFPCLMLALTPRWVLLEVNDTTSFGKKMKQMVRERLKKYDTAPIHPALKWYGSADNYEWQQYFLRDDETIPSKCPFHRMLGLKNRKDS
ncbi:YqcI/YcgG family protein [Ectobacillus ponti]|uniref:YqcI/YcgG family protein n=1 Tax=Ectobacillus ponti TaxID=2961894 RepID=A0AA41X8R4_9BACI|nr:YqcI/YcgG family protein [Ectobacillus ponti]MCP8969198.1 YqcI/YcgG family protein [Ectobacillus ponti]